MKQLVKLWISSTGFDEMSKKQKKNAIIFALSASMFFVLYPISIILAIISTMAVIYTCNKDIPVHE